jgi:predicted RNase H-like HicB family nuclease
MVMSSIIINTDVLEGELDCFLDTPANHSELIRLSEKYRNIKYLVVLTKLVDGEWLAEHKDLPGCKIHGTTPEEAMTKLEEVKLSWIYVALAEGREIPKPTPGVAVVKIV